MSKQELIEYRSWFEASLPPRLGLLKELVRSSRKYRNWVPDFSPSSIGELSEWSQETLELEGPRGEESPTEISILMDIAMYMGESLVRASPSIKWEHNIRCPRNDVDFGAMVINGPSGLKFDPFRIIYVASLILRDGRLGSDWLSKTFELRFSLLIDGWDGKLGIRP
ncbi:hypothetical protein EU803_15755 [Loktanella sp. IMCC34160]|uniref:hypothetical protein n=1 Tax=Loktanella sp. IMCC34160 TaxID=2510646 RepID=UPI00101C7866|nr:hypothetical protein [Loktanella sp. IMCC34160]RYG90066.1 hypothetical protein EU803_15755 [Loktanella sp. IMCC34160]